MHTRWKTGKRCTGCRKYTAIIGPKSRLTLDGLLNPYDRSGDTGKYKRLHNIHQYITILHSVNIFINISINILKKKTPRRPPVIQWTRSCTLFYILYLYADVR